MKNQRDFFDNLAQKIGISSPVDWYNVEPSVIAENGGGGILQLYSNSMYQLLCSVYPGSHFLLIDCQKRNGKFIDSITLFLRDIGIRRRTLQST